MVKDSRLSGIYQALLHGTTSHPLEQGRLLYRGRVVLAKSSPFVNVLLTKAHDSHVGGHLGAFKTYRRLATTWYWVGMFKYVKDYVACCMVCQTNKYSNLLPGELL